MKRLLALLALVGVGLFVACQDGTVPTIPDSGGDGTIQAARGGGGPPVGQTDAEDPEGEINQLLTALFGPKAQRDAKTLFADVKSALEQGDQGAAEEAMRELVNLALEAFAADELQDPGGPAPPTTLEALEELIDLLFKFVGLPAPEFDLSLVQALQGEDDFAVQLVGPEGADVVTNTKFAGVTVPDAAIGSDDGTDENVLITIRRLDPDDQPGDRCLPTGLPQLEGCYEYERFPDGDFATDVSVGICIDKSSDPDWKNYLLHKFDPENPGAGVVQLAETTVGFLDCAGFAPLAAADGSGLWNLASAGWNEVWSLGGDYLVAPLRAADTGAGGLTLSFSNIGWAEPFDLQITSGNGQSGPVGQPLPQDPTVEVLAPHFDSNALNAPPPVPGVDVTFAVTDGGGTIGNGQTSVTVTTNSNGRASIPWTPAAEGANNELSATVPGDTVVFTATGLLDGVTIDFESLGNGSPVASLNLPVPLTSQYSPQGVKFSFVDFNGNSDFASICNTQALDPVGVTGNHAATPAGSGDPCAGWTQGTTTMTFTTPANAVQMQLRGNDVVSPFPVQGFDQQDAPLSAQRSNVFTYTSNNGFTARQETVTFACPGTGNCLGKVVFPLTIVVIGVDKIVISRN